MQYKFESHKKMKAEWLGERSKIKQPNLAGNGRGNREVGGLGKMILAQLISTILYRIHIQIIVASRNTVRVYHLCKMVFSRVWEWLYLNIVREKEERRFAWQVDSSAQLPQIFKGASNSKRIGCFSKISLALMQRPFISSSVRFTCLPGLYPRTAKSLSRMLSISNSKVPVFLFFSIVFIWRWPFFFFSWILSLSLSLSVAHPQFFVFLIIFLSFPFFLKALKYKGYWYWLRWFVSFLKY